MLDTLTVVIPTLDEAERLPVLLDQLARQTRPADEIVVADADSADDTRGIARERGAIVVDGGKPAVGRNAGARVATGDLILFLDADVDLDDGFIAAAVEEFRERSLAVASALVEPIERDAKNRFACDVVNFYLEMMQYVAPHAPGFCILVRRDVHEAIGGFDEMVVLAEDHDYAQRAAGVGKFRMLHAMPVRTSMRRIDKEGLIRLAFKYLYAELYVVTGQKIREVPFDYEFASFAPEERSESLEDVGVLRERLGALSQTFASMSADGRDALRQLAITASSPARVERALERFGSADVAAVNHYVRARVRLARRGPARVLRRVRAAGADVWREVTRTPD